MICPYCGKIDTAISTPEITRTGTRKLLGNCECGKSIWAIPTQKKSETSQLATVIEGETREEVLTNAYLRHEPGAKSERRTAADDIDRDIYDENGKLLYFLEIKERSNSLNAYRLTQFPFAKIESGKQLMRKTGLPVYIVLKFIDCWAKHRVDLDLEYQKGSQPFAPRYRSWQRAKERQIPVMIPVESLEILPWRDLCQDVS